MHDIDVEAFFGAYLKSLRPGKDGTDNWREVLLSDLLLDFLDLTMLSLDLEGKFSIALDFSQLPQEITLGDLDGLVEETSAGLPLFGLEVER